MASYSDYSKTPAGTNNANANAKLNEVQQTLFKNMLSSIGTDSRYENIRSNVYGDYKNDVDAFLSGGNFDPDHIATVMQNMSTWCTAVGYNAYQMSERKAMAYTIEVVDKPEAINAALGLPDDFKFESSEDLNKKLQKELEKTRAANDSLKEAEDKRDKANTQYGAGVLDTNVDNAKKGVDEARADFVELYKQTVISNTANEVAYYQDQWMGQAVGNGFDTYDAQSAAYQYAYSTLRLSRLDASMVDQEHLDAAKDIIKAANPDVDFDELAKQMDDDFVTQMGADLTDITYGHWHESYKDDEWHKDIENGDYDVEAVARGLLDSDRNIDGKAAAKTETQAQNNGSAGDFKKLEYAGQTIEQKPKTKEEKLEDYFMAQGTKASAEDINKAWNALDADTQKKLSENLVGRDNYLGPTYDIPYGTPGESSALSSARSFAEGAVEGDYGSSGHWKYELEQSLKNGDAYQLGVPGSSVSKIADKYLSDEDIKAAFNNSACTEAILESYGECAANSAISDTHKDATEQIWKYLPDDKKKELEDSLQGPPDGKYVFKLSESDVYDSDGNSIEPDVEALRADYYDELYRYAKAHGDDELAGKAAKNLPGDGVVKADKWLEENKDYDWTKSQFDANYEPSVKEVEIPDAQVPLGASAPESKWTAEKIEALYAEAGDDRTKIAQLDYQMATEVWKGNIGTGDDRKALFGDQYERIQLCAINNVANGSMTAWAQPGTDEYNKLIENLAVDGAAYDICDGKDIDLDDLTKQGLDDNAVLAACDKWQGKDSNQAAVEQIEKSETKPADEKQATGEKPETDRKQIETPATTTTDNKPERTERVSFAAMDTESQEKFFGSACKSYAEKCGWDLSSPEAFRAAHYEFDEADFSTFMNETAKAQGIIYDTDYLTSFTEEAAKVNGYTNTLPKSATIAAYATFSDKDYRTNWAVDDLCAYAGDLNSMDGESQDKFFGAACKSYADKYGWDLSSPEAYQAGKYTLDNDNFLACVDEVAKEQGICYNKETFANNSPDNVAAYAAYAAKDYAGDVSDLFETYVSLPDDSNTADTGWNTQGGFSGGGFTVGSASLEAAAAKYTTPTTSTTPTTPQTEAGLQAGG